MAEAFHWEGELGRDASVVRGNCSRNLARPDARRGLVRSADHRFAAVGGPAFRLRGPCNIRT